MISMKCFRVLAYNGDHKSLFGNFQKIGLHIEDSGILESMSGSLYLWA